MASARCLSIFCKGNWLGFAHSTEQMIAQKSFFDVWRYSEGKNETLASCQQLIRFGQPSVLHILARARSMKTTLISHSKGCIFLTTKHSVWKSSKNVSFEVKYVFENDLFRLGSHEHFQNQKREATLIALNKEWNFFCLFSNTVQLAFSKMPRDDAASESVSELVTWAPGGDQ